MVSFALCVTLCVMRRAGVEKNVIVQSLEVFVSLRGAIATKQSFYKIASPLRGSQWA